jgi:hypothetical protein
MRWHELLRMGPNQASMPQSLGTPICATPVLLFHDSLGCVALWRSFPRHLASPSHRLPSRRLRPLGSISEAVGSDFIRMEAQHVVPRLCEQAHRRARGGSTPVAAYTVRTSRFLNSECATV